ncbi:unnamed protein product [Somion occarium]|uniref:PHD-type domain-containing protein n=1 Tax=Somion occarium TaxID=3059160 RepID=A0ABP1E850_9APHY
MAHWTHWIRREDERVLADWSHLDFYFNHESSLLEDRLWIQRALPKPPRPQKRKRQPAAKPKPKPSRAKAAATIEEEDFSEEELPPPPAAKRTRTARTARITRGASSSQAQTPTTNGTPRARAAKLQANKKLDAQYKELEAFQREAAAAQAFQKSPTKTAPSTVSGRGRRGTAPASPSPRPILGTRASARIRGTRGRGEDDDEWQQIPEEWLAETASASVNGGRVNGTRTSARAKAKAAEKMDVDESEAEEDKAKETELFGEGDSMSELTELSDETPPGSNGTPALELVEETKKQQEIKKLGHRLKKGKGKGKGKPKAVAKAESTPLINGKVEELAPVPEEPAEEVAPLPPGFIEWEAIAITLTEWEHVAEPFEKATHYLEKALYKVLSQVIVPAVTAELRETERKRKLEEAVVHRKRSSRIAIKESEKEEARMLAKKRAEEAEKQARARRLEARAKKEEAEREKRENAREQRRLEREERERKAREEEEAAEISAANTPKSPSAGPSKSQPPPATSQTKESSDWMLDCEICGKRGRNLDGNLDLVSCGSCSRWQHIQCHDYADHHARRPRRNWETQQFTCSRCRIEQANRRATMYAAYQNPPRQGGQWQDGPVLQLHPTQSWSSSASSQGQVRSQALPTSDLRHSAYPSSSSHASLASHAGHSGQSYQTVPLSQSQYGVARTQSGSPGYSYVPSPPQYGPQNHSAYPRQAPTYPTSQYPQSNHRSPQPPMQDSWSLGYQSQGSLWNRPETTHQYSRTPVNGSSYPQAPYPSHSTHTQGIPANGQDVPMVSSNHVSYPGHSV